MLGKENVLILCDSKKKWSFKNLGVKDFLCCFFLIFWRIKISPVLMAKTKMAGRAQCKGHVAQTEEEVG